VVQKSTFLFWNLNDRDLAAPVAALAKENEADFVVLAEASRLPIAKLLQESNNGSSAPYYEASRSHGHLRILTRFRSSYLTPRGVAPGSRWSIDRLRVPGRSELLIVSVHLRSKLRAEKKEQYALARRLGREILEQEAKLRHRRTVILGDFNMNPDEDGMLACDAMHGCMSRRELKNRQASRQWDTGDYPMFFNPMWSHLGDREGRPPGTYYYSESKAVARYWHMLDQVLVRPDLLPAFTDEDVRIVTRIGSESLLDHLGRPDTKRFSDHLPLLVRLHF